MREGIKNYKNKSSTLVQAIRGIKVINADHEIFLKNLPDNWVDIVYFDPMFRNPLEKSSGISPLRELANYAPISKETITESQRVAKKRIVIKETFGSEEFSRLGFGKIIGGKKSPISYGIMEVGGETL